MKEVVEVRINSGIDKELSIIELHVLESSFKFKVSHTTPFDFLIAFMNDLKSNCEMSNEIFNVILSKSTQLISLLLLCTFKVDINSAMQYCKQLPICNVRSRFTRSIEYPEGAKLIGKAGEMP